jgi:hypothetical protein
MKLHNEPQPVFESYIIIVFSRCLVFSKFVFYFTFLNCRLVMVFGHDVEDNDVLKQFQRKKLFR